MCRSTYAYVYQGNCRTRRKKNFICIIHVRVSFSGLLRLRQAIRTLFSAEKVCGKGHEFVLLEVSSKLNISFSAFLWIPAWISNGCAATYELVNRYKHHHHSKSPRNRVINDTYWRRWHFYSYRVIKNDIGIKQNNGRNGSKQYEYNMKCIWLVLRRVE